MKKGLDFIGVSIVFYCHDGQGNFVMHRRSENCRDEQGKWDCGGGSLEHGQTVEENLRREIKEEYCADVLEYQFMGFRDVHREVDDRYSHWIALDYMVLVNPAQVKIGEPDKMTELAWFKPENLPSEIHSQLIYFLKKNNFLLNN